MRRPAGRLAAAGTFSAVGDAAGQLLTTGHVDWQEVATSAGINALAGTAVHGLRSGSATAPALARLMGEPRYQQFLADVQNIKAENPSLAAIPDDNLVAIRGYTSFDTSPADYTKINAALRSADPTAIAPLQPYVDNISHGLAQLPDHTGMVFRGTNLPAGVVAQYERALQSGQPLTQPAFLSTSADPAVT
ncbi:MAG: hypothetical protein JOZ75_03115, partial [Candidatus Dormibacteraeota bacterium]|nr:hypothetical protein [Candidatus Dormibacteraeota bacterium]